MTLTLQLAMSAESPISPDPLSWLMRVARRADQLAAFSGSTLREHRRVWLRAEFEIFESLERTGQLARLSESAELGPEKIVQVTAA